MLELQRKKWLNQALAGMFTDEVKILKGKLEELSDIFKSNREEDEERKENLLEYIVDLCDRIDNAKGKTEGRLVKVNLTSDRLSYCYKDLRPITLSLFSFDIFKMEY